MDGVFFIIGLFALVGFMQLSSMAQLIVILVWYGIGVIGTGIVDYIDHRKVTWRGLVLLLTLGGIFGPFSVCAALSAYHDNKSINHH